MSTPEDKLPDGFKQRFKYLKGVKDGWTDPNAGALDYDQSVRSKTAGTNYGPAQGKTGGSERPVG